MKVNPVSTRTFTVNTNSDDKTVERSNYFVHKSDNNSSAVKTVESNTNNLLLNHTQLVSSNRAQIRDLNFNALSDN